MSTLITALSAAAPLASGWAWHTHTLRRRLHAARRDPLSGLPTRAAFEQQAQRALARRSHAVLLIDLDGFKALNDTFGHAAGDTAIRATAASLTDVLDGHPGALAARLGGDEFTAVVPWSDPGTLPWLLAGLHGAVTAPFRHEGRALTVGASIGAYIATPLPAPALPAALRRADEAMYDAKRGGGGWRIADGPAPAHATSCGRRSGRPGTTAGETR
ncbi:GGDEF domain-containing protein [Streptomyces sp. DH24]|uniref:GGDEF domain-containing protein n=1 Tax=Streptomyces sp. DH24 TaxID=3040123 RepID=UPI002442E75E|nr:GGDEF domain-containing protein [Streptomyces sp. DH24]MDG9717427.1 GGDEF domain-containing protein [Streptomyces sp. DH24]